LIEHRDHDPHPYVRERCAALVKIADGQSAHAVARHGLLKPRDPDTVYGWLSHYQETGLDGLLGYQQGGPRRRSL
jgi:transposase